MSPRVMLSGGPFWSLPLQPLSTLHLLRKGKTMTHYGVMTDYEYSDTHKRDRITVWTGPFASVYVAEGFSLPKGNGYMLTTYNGDKVRVTCPAPRTDATYQVTDAAIQEALSKHFGEEN